MIVATTISDNRRQFTIMCHIWLEQSKTTEIYYTSSSFKQWIKYLICRDLRDLTRTNLTKFSFFSEFWRQFRELLSVVITFELDFVIKKTRKNQKTPMNLVVSLWTQMLNYLNRKKCNFCMWISTRCVCAPSSYECCVEVGH